MRNLSPYLPDRLPVILLCVAMAGAGISSVQFASAANGSVAYTYDALGRVTTASYDTGVCLIYTYDANGNRLSQKINVNTGDAPTWGSGVWGCFKWTPH